MPLPLLDIATYDAYGQRINSTGSTENAYRFAGEQFDGNVGQYYLRARYYDAGVGRFTGRDPFEGEMMVPLSLAKYPYVHGNPVNATDPSGLYTQTEQTATILGIEAEATQSVGGSIVGSSSSANTLTIVNSSAYPVTQAAVSTSCPIELAALVAVSVAAAAIAASVLLGDPPFVRGYPTIVFGAELPNTTQHIGDAISGIGDTAGSPENPGRALSFLLRVKPPWTRKDLLGRKNPIGYTEYWYNLKPQCSKRKTNDKQVCDEYPFASTLQGGQLNYEFTNRVSLRLVPESEQLFGKNSHPRNQARILDLFYKNAVPPNNPLFSWFAVGATFASPFSFWITSEGIPKLFP